MIRNAKVINKFAITIKKQFHSCASWKNWYSVRLLALVSHGCIVTNWWECTQLPLITICHLMRSTITYILLVLCQLWQNIHTYIAFVCFSYSYNYILFFHYLIMLWLLLILNITVCLFVCLFVLFRATSDPSLHSSVSASQTPSSVGHSGKTGFRCCINRVAF